jgi:hypothetical protein
VHGRGADGAALRNDPTADAKQQNALLDRTTDAFERVARHGHVADLRDPALMKQHRGHYHYVRDPKAKLYVHGVGANDVLQGQAGDCYLLATLGALAKSRPGVIKHALHPNRDGTVTVTFKTRDANGKVTPHKVRVDRELAGPRNDRLYAEEGRSGHEQWVPIIEKAYAKWKGNFDKIGNGGWPADALTALTGRAAQTLWLSGDHSEGFQQLKAALASGAAVTASTGATASDGIVPAHAYSVLGAFEKNGQMFVKLRNPWGFREYGHDRKDDGSFVMPYAKFDKNFQEFSWA